MPRKQEDIDTLSKSRMLSKYLSSVKTSSRVVCEEVCSPRMSEIPRSESRSVRVRARGVGGCMCQRHSASVACASNLNPPSPELLHLHMRLLRPTRLAPKRLPTLHAHTHPCPKRPRIIHMIPERVRRMAARRQQHRQPRPQQARRRDVATPIVRKRRGGQRLRSGRPPCVGAGHPAPRRLHAAVVEVMRGGGSVRRRHPEARRSCEGVAPSWRWVE
ncbi:hypothetical protein C8F04DRAFT_1079465 [Mycena alexandri]|uniref:Uncharacterized protein n=1 Tax=Mycena alexandri TaxID=1745969 RepID=A0AAD6XB70_9AGAR|nr:hypothetical protein C8F04DRAFT_1079465 [Mycena alexandri]